MSGGSHGKAGGPSILQVKFLYIPKPLNSAVADVLVTVMPWLMRCTVQVLELEGMIKR